MEINWGKVYADFQFKHSLAFASPRTQGRDPAQDVTACAGSCPFGNHLHPQVSPSCAGIPMEGANLEPPRNEFLE